MFLGETCDGISVGRITRCGAAMLQGMPMFTFGRFSKVIVTMSNRTASVWVSIIPASPPFGFFCLFVFVLMGNLYYYLVVLVLWWWWLMRVNSFFIFIDHLDILLCDVFIKWFCSFFCWALSPSFSPSLPHPFLSFLKYVFKKLELFDIYRKITKIVQGILVCFPPSFPQS